MNPSLSLFRRAARGVRWYLEDVLTAITGKGTRHFTYHGRRGISDIRIGPRVNPATGLPMVDHAIDVGGNPYGARVDHR